MRVRLAGLFGFLFGFAMAFVTLLTYGNSVSEVRSEKPTTIVVTTGEGSLFRSSSSVIVKSEPDSNEEVRVVCLVLTHSGNRHKAQHLNATWGKRCNRLIFISNEDDIQLGAIDIGVDGGYNNLWAKTRQAFRYAYENLYNEGEWFLKADDDTYIVMENLKYMLYGYNAEVPIYFGHKFMYEETTYMSGGGGYVLSKEALRQFMTDGYHNDTLCVGDSPGTEDYEMGSCLSKVGIKQGNSVDLTDSTQRFFPLTLGDYIQPNATSFLPDWLYNRSVDTVQTGPSCCSEYAISFHYVEPKDMYIYDFLLYRMKVHGLSKQFRALPDKKSRELG